MFKEKKGFTLVEIIVCISLLTLIAVIAIVFNVNKDEDKDKKKIISNIVAAADVYGSMNNEIIEKARANYGYYVLTIDELKDMGILDVNQIIPTLSEEELILGKNISYDKIILSINDDMGFINYIYPYFDNDNIKIVGLTDLDIESFEKEFLQCNSGLNADVVNYLNRQYEVVSSDNYVCGLNGDINDSNFSQNFKNSLHDGEQNILYYKIKNFEIFGTRKIFVREPFTPIPYAYSVSGSGAVKEYTCGSDWINQNVILTLKDIESRNNINVYVEDRVYDVTNKYEISESGIYNINYTLKGLLSDKEYSSSIPLSCQIKIDKLSPTMELNIQDGKRIISLHDDNSGVDSYRIKTCSNNSCDFQNEEWQSYISQLELEFKSDKEYALIEFKDVAGNTVRNTIEGDSIYPSIEVNPIPNSFSKFKVTIKNINNEAHKLIKDSIRVQYVLNSKDFNPSGIATSSIINDFNNKFKYNSNLENNALPASLPTNYINYRDKVEGVCNDQECTFVLDMEEFINYCANSTGCTRILDFSDLYNLNIDYYIYVKNVAGNYKRVKITSKLNVFVDSGAYVYNGVNKMSYDKIGDYRGISSIQGINDNQDILFTYCKNDNCEIYFHNNQNNQNYFINSYDQEYWGAFYDGTGGKDGYFTKFTNDEIEYYSCWYNVGGYNNSNFMKYTKYNYNILTNRLMSSDDTTLNSSIDRVHYNCDTIDTSNMKVVYPPLKYTEIENYSFLSNFISRYRYWYKYRYDSSKNYYLKFDNLLDDRVFSRKIDNLDYNYVLINENDSYSNIFRKNLYFYPEVSISIKSEVSK